MFVLRGCERDGMDAGVCRSTTTTNETNQPQITENPPLLFVPRNNLNSLIKHSTGLARTTIPASAMKQITPDRSSGHNRSFPIPPFPFLSTERTEKSSRPPSPRFPITPQDITPLSPVCICTWVNGVTRSLARFNALLTVLGLVSTHCLLTSPSTTPEDIVYWCHLKREVAGEWRGVVTLLGGLSWAVRKSAFSVMGGLGGAQ